MSGETVAQIAARWFEALVTRDEWGARYRNGFGSRLHAYPLPIAVIHHSVTEQLPVEIPFSREHSAMRALEQIGQNRFGGGISYTGACFPSARCYQGLGFSRLGAHTGGYNTRAFAFVLVGNADVYDINQEQKESMADAIVSAWHEGIVAAPRWTHCHHDLNGTTCPGRFGCAARQDINEIAARKVAGEYSTASAGEPQNGTQGPGPFSGFIVATEDGALRMGPNSSYRAVIDVKAGQVLNASEGESDWHTKVGDYWFPNRRVEKSNGVKRRGLLPGDWPMRDMPRTGRDSDELDYAWRELLTQVGHDASNVWTAKLDWLAARSYKSGNGHARMQQALADRKAPNGEPFYQGRIDGHQGPIQLNAEIDWLNWQRQFLDVAPKHYSHY